MPNSILNDVLGPIMRGPSSSHTAGSHHIGQVVRALLGEVPVVARFTFDSSGSYLRTYRQQGVDKAFTTALLGWPLTDARFLTALELAAPQGLQLTFDHESLPCADHPNTVRMELTGQQGASLHAVAQSTGGGSFVISQINDWPVALDGKFHSVLLATRWMTPQKLSDRLPRDWNMALQPIVDSHDDCQFCQLQLVEQPDSQTLAALRGKPDIEYILTAPPVYRVPSGPRLFHSSTDMVKLAKARQWSLGEVALQYEMQLLRLSRQQALQEMVKRLEIMLESVRQGLDHRNVSMQLLAPSAGHILQAERESRLIGGGAPTRAAARAMAAMHISNSQGVVCAAPTGGSAGVIPGLVSTLIESKGLSPEQAAMLLFAAGAIGLIIANRATFAAEVAGCQVEIGAAGAMAAAAAVEAGQGSIEQAVDAAAIALHNTMGSPCDLVQGTCEVPCHTRNAVAAAAAFVCADLILGGYRNPIPLDETIDAMYAVGQMMPSQLRCTSLGGLAATPAARALGGACGNCDCDGGAPCGPS